MKIQAIRISVATNQKQSSKIQTHKTKPHLGTLNFTIPIQNKYVNIKIEYFYKKGILHYQTFLEDPNLLLDLNTKKKIESISQIFF